MIPRISFLVLLALLGLDLMPVSANPPDIEEKSPDGKWLFRAHWYGNDGDSGYLWDLQNVATAKTYFTEEKPGENEGLPARIGALWSPNHRYLAINFYYGRICYGVDVIALRDEGPKDHQVTWPAVSAKSMIKPEDRPLWKGDGVVNCAATGWERENILLLDFYMKTYLEDKASGTKFFVGSERTESIKFTGLNGKVMRASLPDYEKVPIQ